MRWKAFTFTMLAIVLTSSFAAAQNPRYLENLERLINRANEAAKEAENEDIDPDDLAIETILDRAGGAFESGDASELEECLVVGKRKVYLSIAAGGKEPDHYGTSQLKFIFDEIFREVRTESFLYDTRDIERYNGIAIARADWTYDVVADDEIVTEHLQLRLEKKGTIWRIFEIRSAPR